MRHKPAILAGVFTGIGITLLVQASPATIPSQKLSTTPTQESIATALLGHNPVASATETARQALWTEVTQAGITPDMTVGEFIRQTDSEPRLRQLIGQATLVGRPRWLNESTCQIRLQMQGGRVADELRAIAAEDGGRSPLPVDALAEGLEPWRRRLFESSGIGSASGAAVQETSGSSPLPVFSQPPPWRWRMIDAQGQAGPADSRLRAARRADQEAIGKLREQILALPLNSGKSLGQAAAEDPRIAQAAERALLLARTHKVEYQADGGVRVWLHLDLRTVWGELQALDE